MSSNPVQITKCWCGCKDLSRFSEGYVKCRDCGTLIASPREPDEFYLVKNDEKDFYGKKYWLDHFAQETSYEDVFLRARHDLSERCLYWLKTLLYYKSPPGKFLEIGCAHGALVALTKLAGFESMGLELSPWLVKYFSKAFGIHMMNTRFETADIQSSSLDCIGLFDVLEHFIDPKAAIEKVSNILRPNAIVLIQTPCNRKPDLTYDELKASNDVFMEQMNYLKNHLFLFTESGLTRLLREVGLRYTGVEPNLFPYDISIIASKSKLSRRSDDDMAKELLKTPNGRIALALLDTYQKLRESDADRAARLKQVETLTTLLKESDTDRTARLKQVEMLAALLKESEKDRADRLVVIQNQDKLLKQCEAERANVMEQLAQIKNKTRK